MQSVTQVVRIASTSSQKYPVKHPLLPRYPAPPPRKIRLSMCAQRVSPLNSHVPDLSRGVLPAELLPVSGFITPHKAGDEHALHDLILRVNAGSLAYLGVPASLVYRWACLCGRWAPDLQMFIAQVLRHTGNLDHFLVQPAALDHHRHAHGLLETSITAAELAMCAEHDATRLKPLPLQIDELQQVCSAAAFLFDVAKVFDPSPGDDAARSAEPELTPYGDLSRCWRSSWKALAARNPLLAGWMYHIGRPGPCSATAVRVARTLTHHAVQAAWHTPSSLPTRTQRNA